MSKPNHYVNNKDLLVALIAYKKEVKEAKKVGKPKPRINNYIGQCIDKIAQNLSRKPNFAGYSYREEMVGDGIENCIMYFDNFDPKKSKNPFAYFTQIIYFAFLRRIHKERKQQYTKYKILQNLGLDENREEDDGRADPEPLYDNITDFISNFEEAKDKKKKPAKKGKIEEFMED